MPIQLHKKTLLFVMSNLFAKGLAAIAQLYAIFVFTKMQTKEDAALIFILLGYSIWFQVFEFGLAQTLQNKFNAKNIFVRDISKVILIHYCLLIMIASLIIGTTFLPEVLISINKIKSNPIGAQAFSIGAAIMVLASGNVITQRLLLIMNKGLLGNGLVLCQSIMIILGLGIYQLGMSSSPITAVLIYLGPQILVYMPLQLRLFMNLSRARKSKSKAADIFYDSVGFFGITLLIAIFLGSDYYFVAHYLSTSEIVAYYLVTRVFFISFVVYFAYLQHRVRRLSFLTINSGSKVINSIIRDSIVVGVVTVFGIYGVAVLLEYFGVFSLMTHGEGVGQGLLFFALIYFTARVCRDVGVVVIGNLNAKKLLYKVYSIEVLTGGILMYFIAPKYGGAGILMSLMLACLFGILFLLWDSKAFANSKATC